MITQAHLELMKRRVIASHLHLKTGGKYILLHRGQRESDLSDWVSYQAVATGKVYFRPASEFDDGRFEQIVPGDKT